MASNPHLNRNSITAGSSMPAMTRSRPPQRRQTSSDNLVDHNSDGILVTEDTGPNHDNYITVQGNTVIHNGLASGEGAGVGVFARTARLSAAGQASWWRIRTASSTALASPSSAPARSTRR